MKSAGIFIYLPKTPRATAGEVHKEAASQDNWDINPWLVLALTAPVLVAQVLTAVLWPNAYRPIFYGELSVIEIGTVLVGIGAIVCALLAFLKVDGSRHRALKISMAVAFLGLIYFVGEEASWGQHYFGFEPSAAWKEINTQDELNLHNVRGWKWADKAPRNLLLGGVVIALVFGAALRRKYGFGGPSSLAWLMPSPATIGPAILMILSKAPEPIEWNLYPDPGETEEMYLMVFIFVYLLSLLIRYGRARRSDAFAPQLAE